jgi:hypothetical protein
MAAGEGASRPRRPETASGLLLFFAMPGTNRRCHHHGMPRPELRRSFQTAMSSLLPLLRSGIALFLPLGWLTVSPVHVCRLAHADALQVVDALPASSTKLTASKHTVYFDGCRGKVLGNMARGGILRGRRVQVAPPRRAHRVRPPASP